MRNIELLNKFLRVGIIRIHNSKKEVIPHTSRVFQNANSERAAAMNRLSLFISFVFNIFCCLLGIGEGKLLS